MFSTARFKWNFQVWKRIIFNDHILVTRIHSSPFTSRYCTLRAIPLFTIVSRAKLSEREVYFKVIRLLLPLRVESTHSFSTRLPGCCRGNRPSQAFLIHSHLPSHRWVFPVGLEGGKCRRSEIFKRKKIRVSWAPFVRLRSVD